MKQVRIGVVGVNGMGGAHARGMVKQPHRDCKLTAIADIDPVVAQRVASETGVPFFLDAEEMFDSGLCDAVIIATPHYWHPTLSIRAARRGLHVLTEKPMAVAVGPARAAIAECRKRKVVFAAMLQQRTRGIMRKMKHIVDSGQLGELSRVSMVCSNWYRTQFYYDRGAWRGTWDGEGGGILLNQAPHSLDLFQWLGGMPKRVVATLGTRVHNIEVENTANAICLYEAGKTGYIYATTAEAPGMEQLVIAGDKATMIAEGGKLRIGKLKTPVSKHIRTSKEGFKRPPCDWQEVELSDHQGEGGHLEVIQKFAAHILRGSPLVATGEEAVNELELSNAIYLSGFENRAVDLPVVAEEMDRLLARLERTRSTGRGGNLRKKSEADLKKLRE